MSPWSRLLGAGGKMRLEVDCLGSAQRWLSAALAAVIALAGLLAAGRWLQPRLDRETPIVVDLVQVFTGDAAVRAAIEDGMDRSAAEVRDTYVRNQNDHLRTLEMAGGVQLNLIGSCESTGQEALPGPIGQRLRMPNASR